MSEHSVTQVSRFSAPLNQKPELASGTASALAGVRVVEFAVFAAGPMVGKHMGEHGAEVIRVESRTRPDGFRVHYPPFKDDRPGLERGGSFAIFNDDVLGVTLNLKDPRGAALPVLHMVFVGAVGAAAYKIVKRGTSRPRPFEVLAQVEAGTAPLDAYSFPSGHTLHAVAFTLVALAYWPWLAPLLVPFTLTTAASRVALGLHYPSDVLAGALLGALVGTGSFVLA